jgi:hypothetical protein
LLVALERLAGRGDGFTLGDRLEAYENQLEALLKVLAEIRDRLPDPRELP